MHKPAPYQFLVHAVIFELFEGNGQGHHASSTNHMSHVNVNPDSLPLLAPAGIKRSSSSPLLSPTDKRPKPELPDPILPQDQLAAFNVKMQQRSLRVHPRVWTEACTVDEWKEFLPELLAWISCALSATDLRASPMTTLQAELKVNAFTDEQLREWKDGVMKGKRSKDWTEVISLCKYL
jgi:hypothetical protein